jgi:low temperature requirement protein LtrA
VSEEAGRLARDAYTYLHVPIIAGIIAVAVGDDLLLAHPGDALSGVGAAAVLGGPALFLIGESLFRLRMIGSVNPRRLTCAAALALAGVVGTQISAFALVGIATALLVVLALWEQFAPPRNPAAGVAGR